MKNQGIGQASRGSLHSQRCLWCELQCGVLHYTAGICHLVSWSRRVWQLVYHSCHILAIVQSPFSKSQIRPVVVSSNSPHLDSRSWERHAPRQSLLPMTFHQVVYGDVGVDLIATDRSDTHRWTPQNTTQCPSWLWLYSMQVSVVCGMVSAVNNAWKLEISTQLPVICSRRFVVTLPVTSARILAVVIRLFARASRRILRSSHSVVLLERPVPAPLATLLFWVHLVTARSAVIALQPTVWAICRNDAPITLVPMIRPYTKSER